jgi:hypothetical protein
MLVGLFNAVKVESVPLKFINFDASRIFLSNTPHICTISHTGNSQADAMRSHTRVCGLALATLMGLGVAAGAPASAASDEDQVRAVLTRMNASYNGADFNGFASHLCNDMLQSAGFAAGWYASRQTDGPTQITVNSVRVSGNPPSRAVANVRFDAANRKDAKTLDVDLVRDGADWKACRYSSGRTV